MPDKNVYGPRPGAKKRPEPEAAPADTTEQKKKRPWSPWRKPSLKPIGPAK